MNPVSRPIPKRDRMRIALKANCDLRSVMRYERGLTMRLAVRSRVEQAIRALMLHQFLVEDSAVNAA